jgi:hypothetical protein
MKNLILILLLILVVYSCDYRNEDSFKTNINNQVQKENKYGVKSGIIKYKLTISGNVMDNIISGSGFENLYFDNWGKKELKEELITKTTKAKFFKYEKEEQTEIHNLQKIENNTIYNVDYNKKIINKSANINTEMNTYYPNNTIKLNNILKEFGGEKIGNEIFKGYDCEIWDIRGTKQWLYKGVPLKIEHTLIGVKTIKEAVSADFNVIVVNNEFELPNYPIIEN